MSKKQENIAELMQRDIVLDEEYPFKIPENWVWTKVKYVFERVKEQIQPLGTEKYVGLEHLKKGGGLLDIGNAQNIKSKKVVFKQNDVLYGKLRPYLNKHSYVKYNGVASTDILVYRSNNVVTSKILDMYLDLPHVLKYTNENSNGINLPRVSPAVMDNMLIPLPPLNEQKRIVEKLENLLGKINQSKQLIEETKDIIELRRLAILELAFRGELTRNWRTTNKVVDSEEVYKKIKEAQKLKKRKINKIEEYEITQKIPESWKWVRLGDIFDITSGGTPSRSVPKYYEGNIPWIKTGEIKWNYIDSSEENITIDAIENSSAKIISKNSVLVAMYGQGLTRGRASILSVDAACNQAVCALLPNEYVNSELVYYYFMEGYHRFRKIAKGGNQENLSATLISNFLFPLPPVEEQIEIIRVLKNILDKENEIEELLDYEIEIDRLKQSVLLKAFQGELGTNDPNENHSSSFLKEIIQEKSR